jgi:cytochrome c
MRKPFPDKLRLTGKVPMARKNVSGCNAMRVKKLGAFLALGGLAAALLVARAFARSPQIAQPSRAEAAAPDSARGKQLFQHNCAICHFSTSTAKKIGPGLKGLYTRGHYQNGSKVDDASLRRWIERGDNKMEGFDGRLKPDELRDLIAYLKTL